MPADQLRERREALGLSQEAVARRTGLSVRTVFRAEQGFPLRQETLRQIADALGLRVHLVLHVADGEDDCVGARPPEGGLSEGGA
jgi:transcriptional regulator with XRE-family HTH domain